MTESNVDKIKNLRKQGKSYAEIACALNMSASAVQQRIHELVEEKEY